MGEAATADISSPSSQQTVKADDRDTQRIFRIPYYMCRSEKRTVASFYVPQLVSLGPFHFRQAGLANYESFKEKLPVDTSAFNDMVFRMVQRDSDIRQWYGPDSVARAYGERELGSIMVRDESLKEKLPVDASAFNDLVNRMVQRDSDILQWYGLDSVARAYGELELGSIMARDGLFLMQFLRHLYSNCEASDHISHSSTGVILPIPHPFALAVKEDIMKLENQIPIFALDVISVWEATDDLNSILRHAFNTLSPFRCTCNRENLQVFANRDRHLLELVYENIIRAPNSTGNTEHGSDDSSFNQKSKREGEYITPPGELERGVKFSRCSDDSSSNQKSKRERDITLPRAVQLKRRGVKFSPHDGLLDKIRFDDGNCTIYLPRIELDDRTEAVLRNLLAFEVFVHKEKEKEKPLRCYVDLMDRLINTAEDVELLKHVGIICSDLGSDEEVARLFNGMGKGLQKGKYKPIDTAIEKAIKFCTTKHRIMWAEFKKKHCSKPWLVVALIAGFISLFLSVYQTILASQQVSLQIQSMKCV